MGATGYVLTIPDEVLKKLELADTKINAIAESSEKTANRFNQAFSSMALSVDPLIKRLDALKNIGKLDLGSGLKKYTSDSEKAAAGIAEVANKLNQLKYISSQSSSANNSVLAWQGINENLKIQQQRLDAINRSIKEYENTLSQIQSGKGGVLSKEDQSNYASNLAEAESIKQTIALYQQKQQAIVNYQLEQKKVADNLAKLKSLESDSKSLPEQRKREELERLNALYRSGQSLLQKQAKAEDELGKAAQKVAIALDKAAKAEEKKNSARANKANQEAARAEEQYARALNKSEVTIVQRARKIEALANAQRALNSTGRDYSFQLSKIASETQRLQQANDNVAKSMERVKRSQSSVLNTTDQLTRKIALLFSVSAIQGYVEKLVEVRGEFELQQRALQSILQDKDKADEVWSKTVQLAVRSPFTVKELVTYTKQLAAYRIESDKLYDTNKMLADVSAGLGVSMDRLILAFGQVKAANYLRASEVRQFTEAGVNILGELSNYYSELEGKMVSVGDVQERITKRMVQFGDVEEIFKRITSAGGIFYNMQEVQAETLAGMISNLKDTFDLMFNDVGKANDGILKGFVSILKDIVNNWEKISQIGIPIIMTMITRMAILKSTTKGIIPIMSNFVKVSVVGFKQIVAQLSGATVKARALRIEASKLGATPLNIWLTALTVVLATIWEIHNAIIASKKEQEELNRIAIQGSFDASKSVAEYERLADVVSDATKSYEEQKEALDTLKRTYGDILPSHLLEVETIRNLKGNYDEATQAIYNYTAAKTKEKQIQYVAEKYGSEVADEGEKLAKQIRDNIESLTGLRPQLSEILPIINKLKEGIESGEVDIKNLDKAIEDLSQKYLGQTLKGLGSSFLGGFDTDLLKRLGEYYNTVIEYNEQIKNIESSTLDIGTLVERQMAESVKGIDSMTKEAEKALNVLAASKDNPLISQKDIDDAKKKIVDFYKEMGTRPGNFPVLQPVVEGSKLDAQVIAQQMQEIALISKKNKLIKEFGETAIGYTERLAKAYQKTEFTNLQEKVYDSIVKYTDANEISLKGFDQVMARSTDSTQTYIDRMSTMLKSLKEEWATLNIVGSLTYGTKTKEQMDEMQHIIKFLEELISKNTILKNGKGESEADKRLKKQISLLKEVGKEYEKNLRYYSKEEAAAKTRADYLKTFDEAKFPSGFIMEMSFDPSGIIQGIQEIGKQASKKMALEVERSISGIQSEVDLGIRIKGVDNIRQELEKAFSGYEMSVQLEGLGLDKDVLNKLFNIDYSSLDDLKEKLNKAFPDITKLSQEQFEVYKYFQNKISDAEQKEYEKRLKMFAEYIANSVDKVKQVQNSGALEISFATDFLKKGSLDAEQYATVVKNVTDKVNKEVSKINLDKFKETPEYIQAMGDLSAYSASQLEVMIARMQELINSSAGNLNASDLKVYTDLIDKIQDRLKQIKSPFSKNAFAEFRELKRLQAEFNAETERYNQLLREQKIAKDRLESAKTEAEQARGRIGIDASAKDDLIAATESLQDANSALNNSNDKLNISQGKLSNISGKMGQIQGGMSAAMSMIDKIVTGIYQSINATIDIMNQFKELQESQGVDTSKGGWREVAQAGELLGNVNEKVMSSWNNFKSGNIAGAVADAVGSITTIFTTLNKQHDARRERRIQEEIKQVEKLQKAYQRLGEAIENAYTIDTLNMSTENAQRNIQDQIKSYQNMIAAEEDKKDTDWDRIDEWKEAITDLQEQADQLRSQKLNELGGFGSGADMKSAAEEFASAWLEAYKETGDGLTALEDKWDEYINNVIMKQLALRGIEKFLEPIMNKLDNMIGDDSYLSNDELKELQDDIDKTMPALNEYWKKLAESFKIPIVDEGGSDNASTLSKSVQGVTESTANVIEAYLNSMRFFVSDSNMVLNNFYMAFTSIDPLLNPMYSELNNQTKLLRSIDERLASVITYSGDHPNGGAALKTVI